MIHHGDLFDVLPTLAEASIDACVTDPPYGIGFMNKKWDTFNPSKARASKAFMIGHGDKGRKDAINPNLRGRRQSPAMSPSQIEYDRSLKGQREFQEWTDHWGREVLRVLKPGGHILACGAPRSYHRMASGLEDAGFVVRDSFAWLFGQGFPKSLNLGDGKGTALKPAYEPIVLAWKPFKGSITANVEQDGTGALNVDASCRIRFASDEDKAAAAQRTSHVGLAGTSTFARTGDVEKSIAGYVGRIDLGRWPANVVLDKEAADVLDEMTGELTSGANPERRGSDKFRGIYSEFKGQEVCAPARGVDIGGASRFYYVAKPSREERDFGCVGREVEYEHSGPRGHQANGDGTPRPRPRSNVHPTVKPVELMRWLVRLVTPPSGVVLDPFAGSGTTGMACRYEQRQFIGIEKEADYVQIAECRIAAVAPLFAEQERQS